MSLNVRPILSALLRNRTGAVLVALQIAIALAVLVNAVYIVMQRIEKIGRPTGIDVPNIFVVSSAGFTDRYHLVPSIEEDLAYLRGVPGVIASSTANAIPLSGGGSGQTLVTGTWQTQLRLDELLRSQRAGARCAGPAPGGGPQLPARRD